MTEVFFLLVSKTNVCIKVLVSNVVGGPSIVFNCYEKVNETVIDYAINRSIVGYDADALHLSAVDGIMPTGLLAHFVWNRQQNCLVTEKPKLQHAFHTLHEQASSGWNGRS